MNVGIIGTGAISAKHALAYKNIGFRIVACTNATRSKGIRFAEANGAEYVETITECAGDPQVDYVDLCTLPNFRLPVVELCARYGKHVLVVKHRNQTSYRGGRMMALAGEAGIQLGVVSPASVR